VARPQPASTPLQHVVISCQENRSFDHYFGYAPEVQAARLGPPPGYFQPDADENPHYPFEFTSLTTPDPPHSWSAVHEQWDDGDMDGFYTSSAARIGDGDAAIGYYTEAELPFYYSLLDNSALVGNYLRPLGAAQPLFGIGSLTPFTRRATPHRHRAQARTPAPAGSYSTSGATSAGTRSPKTSSSSAVPATASSTGRYTSPMFRPTV
jgi:hypothetical protein